jgi:hypothetical protein
VDWGMLGMLGVWEMWEMWEMWFYFSIQVDGHFAGSIRAFLFAA